MNKAFFTNDIEKDTEDNSNFRKVEWTGKFMQLVYMSLKPGEDIGEEIHNGVDQFFRIEGGQGTATVFGEEFLLVEDSVLIVPAGAQHNIVNTGESDLKLYTIYTPPNHIDGRVHSTREDAMNDDEDEEFGHKND